MRYLISILTIMTLTACDGHPHSDPQRINEILRQAERGEDPLEHSPFPDSTGSGVAAPTNCDTALTGNAPAADPTVTVGE